MVFSLLIADGRFPRKQQSSIIKSELSMMDIPCYPVFAPLTLDVQTPMEALLGKSPDGVSEFTFANLYLFRERYGYRVSLAGEDALVLSGVQPPHGPGEESRSFFLTPCAAPEKGVLMELLAEHGYWKNIPDSIYLPNKARFEEWGVAVQEDRDNFDYLYLRTDLAELAGKKYHKKRNLVHQFLNLYEYTERPLTKELIPQALDVLERWREDKGMDADYTATQEALEQFELLRLEGAIYFISGRSAGWCLGEGVAGGSVFAVHFEKGIDGYKGIYQFMNQTFAQSLPERYTHINREQDLGDEGLRQAKMTYRPSGFVKKYTGVLR